MAPSTHPSVAEDAPDRHRRRRRPHDRCRLGPAAVCRLLGSPWPTLRRPAGPGGRRDAPARRRPRLRARRADARPRPALARRADRRRRQLARHARPGARARHRRPRRVGRGDRRGLGPHRARGPGRRPRHQRDAPVGAGRTCASSRRGSRASRRAGRSRCRCPRTSTPPRTGSCARSPPATRAPPTCGRASTGPVPSPARRRMPPSSSTSLRTSTCGRRRTEHVLAATPDGPHPVLEWVRGTGLRPVLGVLDDDEREGFVVDYERELEAAYPPPVVRGALPVHADLRRRAHPALTQPPLGVAVEVAQ